jgi:hypothetical protein
MNTPAIYSSKFSRYDFEPRKRGRVIQRSTTLGFGFFEMEGHMRRIILAAAAALAVMAAGSLAPTGAEAMTVSTPAGIAAAVDANGLTQDVAYVCRRVWRCGPYGCGWRRACFYTGGPGYYGRGYYGRPGYYGRRYYRRHYW